MKLKTLSSIVLASLMMLFVISTACNSENKSEETTVEQAADETRRTVHPSGSKGQGVANPPVIQIFQEAVKRSGAERW